MCLHQSIRVMIYPQGGICIHCIPTRGHSCHGILPSGHLHHGIAIRGHSHHDRKHLHHDILTRGHLHHKILCISISTRRHLHRGLNTCTSIIMNKPCISILAWDICIMEITFASLSRSISIENNEKIYICIMFCLHS